MLSYRYNLDRQMSRENLDLVIVSKTVDKLSLESSYLHFLLTGSFRKVPIARREWLTRLNMLENLPSSMQTPATGNNPRRG